MELLKEKRKYLTCSYFDQHCCQEGKIEYIKKKKKMLLVNRYKVVFFYLISCIHQRNFFLKLNLNSIYPLTMFHINIGLPSMLIN